MTMWGGRFEGGSDPLFKQFNDSLRFDARLVVEDIEGSIAWVVALHDAGVLSADERMTLVHGLEDVARLAREDPESIIDADDEDIHSWVETRLIERVGDLGKKLHTGRSRNDQVATDLRLWVRREITRRQTEIDAAMAALVALAEREVDTVLPGYTHLQRAQPVLFAHWCLAYVEMLRRDHGRFDDASHRAGECPLGSAALAGTTYPIDREALATSLGFHRPTANSLDAVSDRDFVVETLAAATMCAVHLSRLAEDMIFFASSEAAFVELDDGVTSGSSLMPQKKNPDALELVRGKTGGILGALVGLCTTLKGLPLAYNKDMQEDKVPIFMAMDALSQCLRIVPVILDRLKVHRERTAAAAAGGYANATELADYLVAQGVPFREAHRLAGGLVREATSRQVPLEDLELDTMRSVAPQIESGVRAHLTIDAGLRKRDVAGGTAPDRVREAVAAARVLHRQPDVELKPRPAAGTLAVRPARLTDVEPVCRLVDFWAAEGENLPRDRDEVVRDIEHFAVAEADGRVVGCGSLVVYTTSLAEIRSLGIDPDHQGGGLGSALVTHFLERARGLAIPRVFVLTRVPDFFARVGFRKAPIQALPEKVFRDCVQCPHRDDCDEVAMVWEPSP